MWITRESRQTSRLSLQWAEWIKRIIILCVVLFGSVLCLPIYRRGDIQRVTTKYSVFIACFRSTKYLAWTPKKKLSHQELIKQNRVSVSVWWRKHFVCAGANVYTIEQEFTTATHQNKNKNTTEKKQHTVSHISNVHGENRTQAQTQTEYCEIRNDKYTVRSERKSVCERERIVQSTLYNSIQWIKNKKHTVYSMPKSFTRNIPSDSWIVLCCVYMFLIFFSPTEKVQNKNKHNINTLNSRSWNNEEEVAVAVAGIKQTNKLISK